MSRSSEHNSSPTATPRSGSIEGSAGGSARRTTTTISSTRYPDRLAAVLSTVANAPDGGVLVHCGAGRDRCGLIVAMILDLVGVDRDDIAADHWLSYHSSGLGAANGTAGVDGTDSILAGRELDPDDHAATLHRLLADHPAETCFPTSEDASLVRSVFRTRLLS